MMGDVELEEGEACCDYNIDQRLEDVMGPFQKHFEGLVTTESLGPVWGDYGSFLPMYKHPPPIITPQTKPLQTVPNFSTPRASNNHRLEGALLNPVTPVSLIRPDRKDPVPSQNTLPVNVSAIKNASKNEATTSEQSSLRLRIKVGSDKPVRKNEAIYSGLGLLSPSSSTENDSDDSGGPPVESPGCVLRDMTSTYVPGDCLVSPLNENLLSLTKADKILETKPAPLVNQFVDASSSLHDVKPIKVNSRVKCEAVDGIKTEGPFLEKCVLGTESFDSKRDLTNESKGSKLSKVSVTVKPNNEAKKNIVPVKKMETKEDHVKRSSVEHNEETKPTAVTKGLAVCKFGRLESQGIDESPSERTNKLTGVQTTGISSSELVKLKSRSRLSLGAVKDKSGIKDIVKVRNSYKDIFDTEVVSDAQQTETAPAEVAAAAHENWVACDRCNAWRLLPLGITTADLPEKWWCSKSTWLPGKNFCDVSEDETTQAVRELNLKTSSQNHVISKIKSRPEGSNSSQVETSYSSMDSRQKRKRLSEANQQLVEKNVVNKPIDVGRNGATVNGEPRPKKLKTMIKNEDDLQTENTQASSKSKLLDRKSCEEVEMPAKKRKLRDQQDTPPYANSVKDKKNGEEKPLVKGNGMKIKLSVSRESSVDKSLNAASARKDLGSERFQFGATSSSSKVSGRRASLQELKGSPVGSVSSSPLKAPNLVKLSPAAGKTISRKAHAKSSIGPEVPRKLLDASQIQKLGTTSTQSSVKGSLLRFKDKDEKSSIQRFKLKAPASSAEQESVPNKVRRLDVNEPASNDSSVGKKVIRKRLSDSVADQKPTTLTEHAQSEPRKDSQKVDVQPSDGSGHNAQSNGIKRPKDAANQNAKSHVKDLSVVSFLKEYTSSQTAMTAFKKAEESKDYADRLKISGFDYECNDAYFDSALKFLHAASLLEAYYNNVSKLKGMVDPLSVYCTAAKLSKICAEKYEKRKEMAAAALAYKCMELAYMRVAYSKSFVTKQDLQTSMQMVTQGESPSSSASDVDNLNNQATIMDKTTLAKNVTHLGNQVVARSQANFTRLLDFMGDVSLAMEASQNTQNAYKAASTTPEESQSKETTVSVKRVVDFSFHDVKEFVTLVQNAREAINRQSCK